MPRGQKGGSGGLRQQPKKKKGGENKRMFKKPKTDEKEKGAANRPAKGQFLPLFSLVFAQYSPHCP